MGLTIKHLLDKRRARKDDRYPLVMRIVYNRIPIQIPSGYSLLETEWDAPNQKIKGKVDLGENVTRLNNILHKNRAYAHDVMSKLEEEGKIDVLSPTEIKKRITGDRTKKRMTVNGFIDELVADMKRAKKKGNAQVYSDLKNKLKSFTGSKKLYFEDITWKFLTKLENAHHAAGGDNGGLSVYMRTLRAVYNKAIKSEIVKAELYPFKDYKIKAADPSRKALSEKDFKTFKQKDLSEFPVLERERKFFLASYYMRGINWMDMCLLQLKNIQGDFERISYVRHKTNKRFSIKIYPPLEEILRYFIGKKKDKDAFIFPVLKTTDKEEQYYNIIKNRRKRLNKNLKEIAGKCEIDTFTIYVARHTYAMELKRQGISSLIIKDGMGHKTEEMTQNYLDSFENTVIDEVDAMLMNEN